MIYIRKAVPVENKLIAGFQVKMAKETENINLDLTLVEKGVNAVFKDQSKGCYYVAEVNGKIAGSLLITYEWSDWRNGCVLWIQSVYVLSEYRNRGVFKHLYLHIQKMVEDDSGLLGIRLYVDKGNYKAMQVYNRLGMNGEHYRLFEWTDHQ